VDSRRRRGLGGLIAVLAIAAAVFAYLRTQSPQEQHVRIVLGDGAPQVVGVRLEYVDPGGDVAREAHFTYEAGHAPRIVVHDPSLKNGEYRLQIEIDARDGRRTVQRQVTLGGGSTQIDVSSKLAPSPS
jgi:hypothetical protein